MNKEKQIEEMAKDLCHTPNCDLKKIGKNCYKGCKAHIYAERAINKGYCKADEVAREIFEDVKNAWANSWTESEFLEMLKKLKKKYTEDRNG